MLKVLLLEVYLVEVGMVEIYDVQVTSTLNTIKGKIDVEGNTISSLSSGGMVVI